MNWSVEDVTDKAVKMAKQKISERFGAGQLVNKGGEKHQLIAVVSRTAKTLERTLERPLLSKLTNNADVRGLLETGGMARMPDGPNEYGSVYTCRAHGVFDVVFMDDSILTVVSPWSKAFLMHLYGLVKPGGVLVVPVWQGAKERTFNRWTKEDLEAFLGIKPEHLSGSDFTMVARLDRENPAVSSIAKWFIDNATSVLLQHAFLTMTEEEAKFDYQAILDMAEADVLQDHGISALNNRLTQYSSDHCYYVGGISYKAPLISHIIRAHTDKTDGLRIIDMGGGYGLLAAELSLDPDLNVAQSICTDISDVNARLASRLYADLGQQLAGKFKFVCQPAQAFDYDGQYDVISFVGSLLYVPKDQLNETMQKTWEAVAPGGILIIHENIKHPRFTRDHDIMFTVEEIDALMEPFGEVHRFASQHTQAMTKDQTGEKTAFRVVRKE